MRDEEGRSEGLVGWMDREEWRGGEVMRLNTENWRVGGGRRMEDMEGMEGLEENWINFGHKKTFPFPAGFSLQTF